ncbi:MAG TPA: hypothetical protein VMY79_02040 [Dehalococcoidia bacterium]|nr:hypothetical protein [Dehalococcoidia bacterium]
MRALFDAMSDQGHNLTEALLAYPQRNNATVVSRRITTRVIYEIPPLVEEQQISSSQDDLKEAKDGY